MSHPTPHVSWARSGNTPTHVLPQAELLLPG